MVSEMAMEDVDALKKEGVEVAPRDVIRLNAFGLKVEKNHDSSQFGVMPRVAVLGDVAFHEPTIGSELWMHEASRFFNLEDPATLVQVRAYSLWKKANELPDPSDKERITKEIKHLFCDLLKDCTMRQLDNALMYAINGNNAEDGERLAIKSDQKEKDEEPEDEGYCFAAGMMRLGVAYEIGTPDEIKKMTTSELESYITFVSHSKYGDVAIKNDHSRNLVNYLGVLDEIRERGRTK